MYDITLYAVQWALYIHGIISKLVLSFIYNHKYNVPSRMIENEALTNVMNVKLSVVPLLDTV